MGHNHDSHHHHHHHHHHHLEDRTEKNLIVAFLLNFSFTIIEFIGGLLTNSVAILSDAIHDLGDSLVIGLSYVFQRFSKKDRDELYSYGYKRFALISALINSIVLLAGSSIIIYQSALRLFNPEEVHAEGMIYIAIFGVLVNGIAVLRLQHGHSANERVVMLHLLEDVLGWVAVLFGAIVIYFWELYILDPLLSIGISGFILWNVYKNLYGFLSTFLQGVPKDVDVNLLLEEMKNLDHVVSVHDTHVWSMDGNYNVGSFHVVIDEGLSIDDFKAIKKQIKATIKKHGVDHETVELEFRSESCEYVDCK